MMRWSAWLCGALSLFLVLPAAGQRPSLPDSLLRLARQHPRPDTARVNLLDDLGWARMQAVRYPAAESAWQQALGLARQLRFGPGQMRVQLHRGENFWQQGQLTESRQATEQSLALARTWGRPADQLKALHRLATIANGQGYYAQALANAQEGLALARRTRDTLRTSKLLSDLGDTYSAQGDFPRALKQYFESVTLLRAQGTEAGLGNDLASIANVYQDQGQHRRALPYYRQAMAVLARQGDSSSVARCLVNAAVAHRSLREYAAAARLLQQAKGIFSRQQQPVNVAAVLENLAILYLRQQQPQRAVPVMNEALGLLRANGDPTLLGSALFNQAQAYYDLGNRPQAERYAREGLALTQRLGMLPDQYNNADLLSKLARQRGDFRQALAYRELAAAAKDSAFNHDKSEALGRLQGDFALSQERQRTTALAQEKQLQAQRLRQQQRELWGLGAGLLLVLGGGALLWRLNRLLARKNAEIEEQRTTLEQLNRTKDRLFSIIGHDLRGPLNSLHAFVSMLHLRQLPQEKLAQYSQRLNQTLDQTLALIDNLLSWAAIQMQAAERVQPEVVNLEEAVAENFRLLRTAAENKQLTLSHSLEGSEQVWADPTMVRLVLRNLLSNAIKFTPAGGSIRVAAQPDGGSWQLAVADSGVGLAPDALRQLLDPAQPVRSAPGTNQETGTGLGLTLCRDFVARNGGRLWAESGGEQRGCTFRFTLPRAGVMRVAA